MIKVREISANFSNISFDPELYAKREIDALEAHISSFRQYVEKLSWRAGVSAEFDPQEEVKRFAERATALRREYWASLSRCASPMITGPAKFPVERNRKARDASDKKLAAFEEHARKARKAAFRRAFPHGDTESGDAIRSSDPEAIEKLRRRIEDAERMHELGKKANRAWANDGIEGLKRIGWPEEEIESCARMAAQCYPVTPYFTQNGSARIRRMKQRLAALERAKSSAGDEDRCGDIVVRENTEIMRIQIIFPGKPDADTRKMLKRHGFRWAPSQGAWQRNLNTNGRNAAQMVMKKIKENVK